MSREAEARRLCILVRAFRVKQFELEAQVAHYSTVIKWLWTQIWSKA